MPVVSISMPEELLERLDAFIEDHGYSGRSEAVREGARGLIAEVERDDGGDETVGVVSALFDHGSGTETRLSELRHDHDDLVNSNVHSHACDACLELFVAEGDVEEVASFVACLRAVDGVTTVEYTLLSPDGGVPAEAHADD